VKKEPVWISKKALLLLHEESLAQFGGSRGVRDEGLLDSALARPQNTYGYNPKSTLAELTAACAYGIAKNHAFADGNKRAAFLSIGLMLNINGFRLVSTPVDAIETMLAVATGAMEQSLAVWIEKNSAPKKKQKAQKKK
jgi:death-on-curing protein